MGTQSGNPFVLVLRSGTSRRFFLDFSDNCVSGPGKCGLVPVLESGDKGLTSDPGQNVFSGGTGSSLLDMAEGNTQDRNFIINFRDDNNHVWVLSFLPDLCESDLVQVTRTSDTWAFVSDGIACLERAKKGDKGPPILQGRYRVPFKFTATLLP